jgi:hypothetical protein
MLPVWARLILANPYLELSYPQELAYTTSELKPTATRLHGIYASAHTYWLSTAAPATATATATATTSTPTLPPSKASLLQAAIPAALQSEQVMQVAAKLARS